MNVIIPGFTFLDGFLTITTLILLVVVLILGVITIKLYIKIRGLRSLLLAYEHRSISEKVTRNTGSINDSDEVTYLDSTIDISENMRRIVEKFKIKRITLATSDGLVVASSYADAQFEAATSIQLLNYGFGAKKDPLGDTLMIFGFHHNNLSLVGIVRGSGEMPGLMLERIIVDTKKALSLYI